MTITTRINQLVNLCEKLNKLRYDDPNHAILDNTFNVEVRSLDNEALRMPGGELAPGRLLKFQVADGYALYIITKVGKRQTEVIHLDYMDGYSFAGVYQSAKGELVIPTQVAIQNLGWTADLKRMFSSVK